MLQPSKRVASTGSASTQSPPDRWPRELRRQSAVRASRRPSSTTPSTTPRRTLPWHRTCKNIIMATVDRLKGCCLTCLLLWTMHLIYVYVGIPTMWELPPLSCCLLLHAPSQVGVMPILCPALLIFVMCKRCLFCSLGVTLYVDNGLSCMGMALDSKAMVRVEEEGQQQ